MKKYAFILFSFYSVILFSQPINNIDSFEINKTLYLNGIYKKAKRLKCYDRKQTYAPYFIYFYKYTGVVQKDSFLNTVYDNLELTFSDVKYFPFNITLIYDINREVTMNSLWGTPYCVYNDEYTKLLRLIDIHKFENVFYLINVGTLYYFALKNEQLYVIEYVDRAYHVYSLDKYVVCCWDKIRFIDDFRK